MGALDSARRSLEAVKQLSARDYAQYDFDAQTKALEDISAVVGNIISVLAGLDCLILEHHLSEEHIDAEAAEEYKAMLTKHKSDLTRQGSMLQTLLRKTV